MDLTEFKGEKLKIISVNRKMISKNNTGIVVEATKRVIVIDFGKYKESFNINTIIGDESIELQKKVNGQWTSLRRLLIDGASRR